MEHNYRNLQTENYQLREYILNLQSRLLENQADFPPAPSHVNLPTGSQANAPDSSTTVEQQLRREMQSPRDAISQLQAAAAQADGRASEDHYDYPGRRTRADESAPSGGDAKAGS